MIQHTPRTAADAPHHQTGEVVWADFGNFLEGGAACRPKARPMILLRPSSCQHATAGLTTQARCVRSGEPRPLLPNGHLLGLSGESYLWSPRPAYISRINVRRHVGWVTREVVFWLREFMPAVVDRQMFSTLWAAAIEHEEGER